MKVFDQYLISAYLRGLLQLFHVPEATADAVIEYYLWEKTP